jgi:hypothetical protein
MCDKYAECLFSLLIIMSVKSCSFVTFMMHFEGAD